MTVKIQVEVFWVVSPYSIVLPPSLGWRWRQHGSSKR